MTVSTSKEPAKIAGMFDAIAGRYDALNHILSGGLDRLWRRRAIRELHLTGQERVLDVCTGTGDLAIEAARRGARDVVGVDFSQAMLEIGLSKVRALGGAVPIRLVRGDATSLPIPDRSCQAATVAFGIRNVADVSQGCRELHRVLAPGGRLAILEFGMPRTPVIRSLYRSYFRHVLPRIGRLVSRHSSAYSYLPASVEEFPSGPAFVDLLTRAGFSSARSVSLAAGAVYLYLAHRK